MKLLKNGLCFNGVWGQSLNLSYSPLGEKKHKKPHNPWTKKVLLCFSTFWGVSMHTFQLYKTHIFFYLI